MSAMDKVIQEMSARIKQLESENKALRERPVAMPRGWMLHKDLGGRTFMLTNPYGMRIRYSNEVSLESEMVADFLKSILDSQTKEE